MWEGSSDGRAGLWCAGVSTAGRLAEEKYASSVLRCGVGLFVVGPAVPALAEGDVVFSFLLAGGIVGSVDSLETPLV